MALSNIFNEPRRELTETLVGVLATLPAGYADWRFATALLADSFGPRVTVERSDVDRRGARVVGGCVVADDAGLRRVRVGHEAS